MIHASAIDQQMGPQMEANAEMTIMTATAKLTGCSIYLSLDAAANVAALLRRQTIQ